MRNVLASVLVVAGLAALTSTQASAWCGGESYGGYDNSYASYSDGDSDAVDVDGGFRGGFERHGRFERRGFDHRGFGGSRGGHRH